MAFTPINKSTDYFNTKLYTGNGSTNTITGLNFEPDMTWLKARSGASGNEIYDAVRGATYRIYPNNNDGGDALVQGLQAWTSDGFTVGSASGINTNSATFASWNWKANGSGSANSDGSISSTVSVNTTSGFSIVTYTGNATSGATIGHGLGVAPAVVLVKRLNSTGDWVMYNKELGAPDFMVLNSTAATASSAGIWYDTAPTSSVFSVGSDGATNASSGTYVAYCFAEIQGFSKFGYYLGNSSNDGPFLYTGFKPAFVMIKQATGGNANEVWRMMDGTISPTNTVQQFLVANNNSAEATSSTNTISMFSNGFKINTGGENSMNTNYGYIYLAFAAAPIVGTNDIPANAR